MTPVDSAIELDIPKTKDPYIPATSLKQTEYPAEPKPLLF